jgi:F-type H+-transporting ATPase subunit b
MTEILSWIGKLLLQSVPTVIFVFLLLVILERWLFRPLTAVLKKREDATIGALARAREQAAQAEARTGEYEVAFRAARQEVYRVREADRRAALAERESALKKAREEAEVWIRKAQEDLAKQIEAAKQELQSALQSLASGIAETVLGESSSAGRERGVGP